MAEEAQEYTGRRASDFNLCYFTLRDSKRVPWPKVYVQAYKAYLADRKKSTKGKTALNLQPTNVNFTLRPGKVINESTCAGPAAKHYAVLGHAAADTIHTDGQICDQCKKGNGLFDLCVTADPILFGKACTNYVYQSNNKGCSHNQNPDSGVQTVAPIFIKEIKDTAPSLSPATTPVPHFASIKKPIVGDNLQQILEGTAQAEKHISQSYKEMSLAQQHLENVKRAAQSLAAELGSEEGTPTKKRRTKK